MGVLLKDGLRRRSRPRTYSLNWDESTPPPQDALMLKPFWKRRSRTCGQTDVGVIVRGDEADDQMTETLTPDYESVWYELPKTTENRLPLNLIHGFLRVFSLDHNLPANMAPPTSNPFPKLATGGQREGFVVRSINGGIWRYKCRRIRIRDGRLLLLLALFANTAISRYTIWSFEGRSATYVKKIPPV